MEGMPLMPQSHWNFTGFALHVTACSPELGKHSNVMGFECNMPSYCGVLLPKSAGLNNSSIKEPLE